MDPVVRANTFKGKPEHVANLLLMDAQALGRFIKMYGAEHPHELAGRRDLLKIILYHRIQD